MSERVLNKARNMHSLSLYISGKHQRLHRRPSSIHPSQAPGKPNGFRRHERYLSRVLTTYTGSKSNPRLAARTVHRLLLT